VDLRPPFFVYHIFIFKTIMRTKFLLSENKINSIVNNTIIEIQKDNFKTVFGNLFNELNVHAQCEHCNSFLSGNIILYRQNLIKKLGIETVEWLESKHEPNHYTIDQIVELKKEYSAKIKYHKL
jgi:hypothetical protein